MHFSFLSPTLSVYVKVFKTSLKCLAICKSISGLECLSSLKKGMVKFSTVHYWLTECFKKEKKKLLLSELLLKSTSSNLWHEVVRETALSNILIALILERTVKTICPFFPHNEVVVLYMQKGKFSQKRVKLQCFKSSTVRVFPSLSVSLKHPPNPGNTSWRDRQWQEGEDFLMEFWVFKCCESYQLKVGLIHSSTAQYWQVETVFLMFSSVPMARITIK